MQNNQKNKKLDLRKILHEPLAPYFTCSYTTLISIVQGLALGALILSVKNSYDDGNGGDFIKWIINNGNWKILTKGITALLMIGIIWHRYTSHTQYIAWRLDFGDTIIPIGFVVFQSIVIYSISKSALSFSMAITIIAFWGFMAYGYSYRRFGYQKSKELFIQHFEDEKATFAKDFYNDVYNFQKIARFSMFCLVILFGALSCICWFTRLCETGKNIVVSVIPSITFIGLFNFLNIDSVLKASENEDIRNIFGNGNNLSKKYIAMINKLESNILNIARSIKAKLRKERCCQPKPPNSKLKNDKNETVKVTSKYTTTQLNHEVIQTRIERNFPYVYLTTISIIQGVALGVLAYKTFDGIKDITSILKFLPFTLTSLFLIMLVSYEYTWFLGIFSWSTKAWDTMLPILLGFSQVAPIFHLREPRNWWFLTAFFCLCGALAFCYTLKNCKSERFSKEEAYFETKNELKEDISFAFALCPICLIFGFLSDKVINPDYNLLNLIKNYYVLLFPFILSAIYMMVKGEKFLNKFHRLYDIPR